MRVALDFIRAFGYNREGQRARMRLLCVKNTILYNKKTQEMRIDGKM